MAVADGEIAVLEFDEAAGTGVTAYGEDFSWEHGVDWSAGFGREVKAGMMLVRIFAEGISTSAEAGGDFQCSFEGWMTPVDCGGVCWQGRGSCFPFFRNDEGVAKLM